MNVQHGVDVFSSVMVSACCRIICRPLNAFRQMAQANFPILLPLSLHV
jgi:hypothetical protein